MCFSWILPANTCIFPDFAGRVRPRAAVESHLRVSTYPCLGEKPAAAYLWGFFPLSSNTLLGLAAPEGLICSCMVKNYY